MKALKRLIAAIQASLMVFVWALMCDEDELCIDVDDDEASARRSHW